MSTPEHPTGHDERGFGERPREAVLGESAETEPERTAQQAAAHERDREGEGNEYAAYEQAMREHVATGMADGPDRAIDERDHGPGATAVGDRTGDRTGDRFDDRSRTASGTNAVTGGGVESRSDDFVTTSYDPDEAPAVGPPGTRMNQGTDIDDTRGYDPTGDTGYVDERRADRNQKKAQQVGAQAAERAAQVRARAAQKAAQLREQAAEKAPHVRAQAIEKAQHFRVQAAEKAPQMQANRGKAAAALAFVLLVLWIRRRQSRRSSRTGDVGAVALDQQARIVMGDTVNALGAQVAATGRAGDKAQVRGRAAMAQQVRAQAVEKAQQVRAQAVERAHHLREQAAEKAQAAQKAQQLAHEAQQLAQALGRRLPRR